MYINNFKIITKLFLVLFFTTLLNAYGEGGAGSVASLPESIIGVEGTLLETYPVRDSDGARYINHKALNRYYSQSYDSSSKVDDPNENFMIFIDSSDGILTYDTGRPSYYWEIVNGSSANESPIFYQYHLAPDGLVATVSNFSNYGDEKLTSGAAITVKLDSTTNITLEVDDYSYEVWKDIDVCNNINNMTNCQVTPTNVVASYAHFLRAEYAAIYFFHYGSYEIRTNAEALRGGRHYGVLTKYEDIPIGGGSASYNITLLGSYTDYDDHSNDKMLFGTGSIAVDFSSGSFGEFKLYLNVHDHNGADFLDITDVQLNLSGSRNQINSYNCHTDNSIGFSCTGEFDYADDSFGDVDFTTGYTGYLSRGDEKLQIGASFYGPNGEEIAGGINHRTGEQRDKSISMAFIGKKQ